MVCYLMWLMWLLTVYNLAMTSVEIIEWRINKHLHKWLGIPPSFQAVPPSSVVNEFKVEKYRTVMMFRGSTDEKASNVTKRSGHK